MTDFNALRQETDEIIQNLLDDGSDPDALYIIEHHVAHHDFDKLEKLVVDAFKLGYEISEAEEVEEDGKVFFVCDIVSEIHPNGEEDEYGEDGEFFDEDTDEDFDFDEETVTRH